jgi:PTH1 family peptidyl-tRNA hydrolase
LVVGLGNPGRKYEGNRHNIGFGVVDALARDVPSADFREKFSGLFARGDALGTTLGLLKPQTYMNESGRSVQAAQAFLKVQLGEILVVHDELDLPFGEVRLKLAGGHAGHNGLRDISARLGADYARLRVGIGRPPPGFRGEVADYVLSDFDAVERATVPDVLKKALSAIERVARLGIAGAMNEVNQKAPQRTPPKAKPAKEPS